MTSFSQCGDGDDGSVSTTSSSNWRVDATNTRATDAADESDARPGVTNLSSGMGTQIHVKELDERSFRELGKCEGQDDHWKEWSLKFRAKIKELNMTLFNDLTWTGEAWCRWGEEGCRDLQPVDSAFGQRCAHYSSVGARRKWIRSLENTGAPLEPVDPYEGAPTHVAGCGAWQDQEGPGLPNAREQMGRMGKQAGDLLQGEDERHGEDWDLDQHGSKRLAGHHLAATPTGSKSTS